MYIQHDGRGVLPRMQVKRIGTADFMLPESAKAYLLFGIRPLLACGLTVAFLVVVFVQS